MSWQDRLDDLEKSNDCPSDNVVLGVKQLLSGPLAQVEAINAEIRRLEEKRSKFEKTIKRCNRILAPIRRIPPDVLCVIFKNCLPTDRYPTMAAEDTPMLLTRICSSWRSIAMAFPSLWTQLHIPFQIAVEGARNSWTDAIAPMEKVLYILKLRCQAVHEWFSRSGSQPLSISIAYGQITLTMGQVAERPDKLSILLFETLRTFSARWRVLEFCGQTAIYHTLESVLAGHTLTSLTQIRVVIGGSWYTWLSSQGPLPPTTLFKAPNLQRISINNLEYIALFPSAGHASRSNITHLTIHTCPYDACFDILRACPQLVYCNIFTDGLSAEINTPPTAISIHLPCLLSFRLHVPNSSVNMVNTLYNSIDAPNLRCTGYYNHYTTFAGSLPAIYGELPTYFIKASTKLTVLEVGRACLSSSNVLSVLKAASYHTLTHLFLYYGVNHGLMTRATKWDPFDMECLVTGSSSDPTMPTLLPHLEVFELEQTDISDDLALRFITSRMDPRSNIAMLKKVVIGFSRIKGENDHDLSEVIQNHAEQAGIIRLDTKFQYAPSTLQVAKKDNFLSPSYLQNNTTTNFNHVTWTYEDKYEFE